jgi:hypothetical protein
LMKGGRVSISRRGFFQDRIHVAGSHRVHANTRHLCDSRGRAGPVV